MRLTTAIQSSVLGCLAVAATWLSVSCQRSTSELELNQSRITPAVADTFIIEDGQIQLCQGYDTHNSGPVLNSGIVAGVNNGQFGFVAPATAHAMPTRSLQGVNQFTRGRN